ncbi:stage II sporulation protein M [Bacillus kwashiorkori]|uniref:stage II sporulation protein M n=1 Tax=Bacillus kwashiorkori TaxID=1522318 RepID=UPI00078467B7|nr:stage II sporulation protein M [Bacillus kwashiorkori]
MKVANFKEHVKGIYKEQWISFKNYYWKYFVIMLLLFIFSSLGVYYLVKNNEELVLSVMKEILTLFEEKNLLSPDQTSLQLAYGLFLNNSLASLLIFLTGIIPIFLPSIGIIVLNGGIIGIVLAFINMTGQSVASTLFASVVPHGIFEIPAIVLSGALAFYVTIGIYRKINDANFSFKQVLWNACKTFIFVCIPLLILAASIEAFITPWIMDQFLSQP